jgi:hypothetical protein
MANGATDSANETGRSRKEKRGKLAARQFTNRSRKRGVRVIATDLGQISSANG